MLWSHRRVYHSVTTILLPPFSSRRIFCTRSSMGFPFSLAMVRLHRTNPDLLNTDTWSSITKELAFTKYFVLCCVGLRGGKFTTLKFRKYSRGISHKELRGQKCVNPVVFTPPCANRRGPTEGETQHTILPPRPKTSLLQNPRYYYNPPNRSHF